MTFAFNQVNLLSKWVQEFVNYEHKYEVHNFCFFLKKQIFIQERYNNTNLHRSTIHFSAS